MALPWICSSKSTYFWNCGNQNSTKYLGLDLTSTEMWDDHGSISVSNAPEDAAEDVTCIYYCNDILLTFVVVVAMNPTFLSAKLFPATTDPSLFWILSASCQLISHPPHCLLTQYVSWLPQAKLKKHWITEFLRLERIPSNSPRRATYSHLPRTMSTWCVNNSLDGGSSAFLGNLF